MTAPTVIVSATITAARTRIQRLQPLFSRAERRDHLRAVRTFVDEFCEPVADPVLRLP
eukprot:gene8008-245_t